MGTTYDNFCDRLLLVGATLGNFEEPIASHGCQSGQFCRYLLQVMAHGCHFGHFVEPIASHGCHSGQLCRTYFCDLCIRHGFLRSLAVFANLLLVSGATMDNFCDASTSHKCHPGQFLCTFC